MIGSAARLRAALLAAKTPPIKISNNNVRQREQCTEFMGSKFTDEGNDRCTADNQCRLPDDGHYHNSTDGGCARAGF